MKSDTKNNSNPLSKRVFHGGDDGEEFSKKGCF